MYKALKTFSTLKSGNFISGKVYNLPDHLAKAFVAQGFFENVEPPKAEVKEEEVKTKPRKKKK